MPRPVRPWKEEMNRGSNRYQDHEEEEKSQKKLDEFMEEEENNQKV